MYKKVNAEWVANLRGGEPPPRKRSATNSSKRKPKGAAPAKYISPFILEARKKALDRARNSSKRRHSQPTQWNDEFAKDKLDYFDPKIQNDHIFKLKPRDYSMKPKGPENDTDNSSTRGDNDKFRSNSKLTTRTSSHSPQNRFGILPRAMTPAPHISGSDDDYDPIEEEEQEKRETSISPHQLVQPTLPASYNDEDDYDPMAEAQAERGAFKHETPAQPRRQLSHPSTHTTVPSPQYSHTRPTSPRKQQLLAPPPNPVPFPSHLSVDTSVPPSNTSRRPRTQSPPRAQTISSLMSPTASWQHRQDPDHRGQIFRESLNPTSPSRRAGSPAGTHSRRNGQTSPYRPTRSNSSTGGPSEPLRVTTRATSPFDEHTIREVLGESNAHDNNYYSQPNSPTWSPVYERALDDSRGGLRGKGSVQKPVQWPYTDGFAGGATDPLVRVLEAHARAQEVTSQAQANVMGNMSKMMATLGKAMVANSKRNKRRTTTRPSAATQWYLTNDTPSGYVNEGCDRGGGGMDTGEYYSKERTHPQRVSHHQSQSFHVKGQAKTSNQKAYVCTSGGSGSGSGEQHPLSRHFVAAGSRGANQHQQTQQELQMKQQAPPSKYRVVDHVLAKLLEMERQEKEILQELERTTTSGRNAVSAMSATAHQRDPHSHEGNQQDLYKDKPLVIPSSGNADCKHSDLQSNVFRVSIDNNKKVQEHPSTATTTATDSNLLLISDVLHDTSDMYAAVRARGGDLYVEKSVTWQQEVAGDHHLRLIRADGVIKSEVEEYKRELRRVKLLRESTFRANKVTLTETCDRLTDALLNDILNEVADEVEGIFVDIADKFIDKI